MAAQREEEATEERPAKRTKTEQAPDASVFHEELFTASNTQRLAEQYASSSPYKHGVVNALFDPAFLQKARNCITENVSFRVKETDIYRISQSGDFANLDGLPEDEKAILSTVLELRTALYSSEFRSFIRKVTGCGPLSAIKTDLSCAEYAEGAHLLNHDDVIGTRRISFILYLPMAEPAWDPKWGGALELYPVQEPDADNPDRPNVPTPAPSVAIPPAFNQFAFFEVVPGHSFHSVEEVVVTAPSGGKPGGVGSRMSISGWYHKPVEGEDGYEGEGGFEAKSSLQQLYATTLEAPTEYEAEPVLPLPTQLSEEDAMALCEVINADYLRPAALAQLQEKFVEESNAVLGQFLKAELADELQKLIVEREGKSNAGRRNQSASGRKTNFIPSHQEGVDEAWSLVGPPHIQRFLALASASPSTDRLSDLVSKIRTAFTSDAFRAWLSCISALLPLSHTVHARRFRPGLDYTLARGEQTDGDPKLDVGLCLTPALGKGQQGLWDEGEVGAWELWLANDESTDEATYGAAADGEDEDGPLLALGPEWNRLHLVLRDPGVLKFVKYVNARAPGSRWDITGEWDVAAIEEEEEDAEGNGDA